MAKAVVLLSGGIDSAVATAMCRNSFNELHALTVNYGQSHDVEIGAAGRIAAAMKLESHKVVESKCFPPSPLTGSGVDGPCVVPARNAVLLAIALSHAVSLNASAIVVGCNASDQADYADCHPEFLFAFERMARCLHQIHVVAPCDALDKAAVLATGRQLNVPLYLTVTCYSATPEVRRCGSCNACRLLSEAEAFSGVTV